MDIKKSVVMFSIVFLSLATIYFYIGSNITGFVVYEENEKVWDFSNAEEYSFDENINFSSNEVKINADIEGASWTTETVTQVLVDQAAYNYNDKLNKLIEKDGDTISHNENKILHIFFENDLNNEDIITFYLKGDATRDLYLCDIYEECTVEGYGLVEYPGTNGYYNMTIVNLDSDKSDFRLVVSDNIKVDLIESDANLNQALFNPTDKLNKVQTKDDNFVEINKNKIFDIVFNDNLDNDDIIELYLKGNTVTDVYLCSVLSVCDSPGYGSVNYNAVEDYYNITISSLDSAINYFNIDPIKVKFDYVTAYDIEIEEHSEINISYVENGVIETNDFEPSDIYSFGLFTVNEELNGQSIDYSYSIDSGENFEIIESGDNLNLTDVTKIRFKANLNSDSSNTAVLSSMSLSYMTEVTTTTTSSTTTTTLPSNETNSTTTTTVPASPSGTTGGTSSGESTGRSGVVIQTRETEKETPEKTEEKEGSESGAEEGKEYEKEQEKTDLEKITGLMQGTEEEVSGETIKLVERKGMLFIPLIMVGVIVFFTVRLIKHHKKSKHR